MIRMYCKDANKPLNRCSFLEPDGECNYSPTCEHQRRKKFLRPEEIRVVPSSEVNPE